LLHNGQNGYDTLILDFLRGSGTSAEIAEADYDIAYLFNGGCTMPGQGGWGGTITVYDASSLDDAGWAEVFSKDVIVVPWAPCYTVASQTAFNARSGQLATFFNAGGDLWMNSSLSRSGYYDVLPPSVLSSGAGISGSTGFEATAAGLLIGIETNMINNFATHNNFTDVASALTVFEVRSDIAISIGVSDARITGTGIGDDAPAIPVPTLTFWGLLLLLISIIGVSYRGLRRISKS
ncbi:MAG: hypothetical protein GQ538_01505, partial [Xanthomonadales bacterium]|nr:hypothetical protein [Xanthomonadales bacterium]